MILGVGFGGVLWTEAKLLCYGAVRDGSVTRHERRRKRSGPQIAGDRHTTTSRQLLVVPTGGVLINTPGLRSLALAGGAAGVAATFEDIEEVARGCRFGDCVHLSQPGCAVTAAATGGGLNPDRLASYRKLQREISFEARRDDPMARRQAARMWK